MILRKIILAALIVTSAAFADFFNVGARAAANFGTAWGDDAKDATWGAGVSLLDKLDVDFRLVLGLNSYMDENEDGFKVSMKHMRMQTGIIYWF